MLDITDTRRAEQTLQESESRYRSLFEYMADGVAVYKAKNNGKDFIFTDINKAGEEISAVTKDTVIGQSVLKMFPGIKDIGLFDVFRRVWKTGKPERHPISHYKDGRVSHWVQNSVYKLPSGEVFAVYSDETEQKQAQESLQESEEKYRQLFNTVSDAIMIIDTETKNFIDVNDTALHLYGYKKEEFLKLNHSDITAEPEDSSESIRQTLAGEISRIPIRYHRRKNGKTFPVEISAGVFEMGDRKVVCGVARDITERRLAEEALRESESRFRLLATISPAGIYMSDVKGDCTYVNESWCDMAGLSPQEAVGRGWVKAIHPEDRERTASNWYKMVESEGQWGAEYRFQTPNGKITWVYGIATEMRDKMVRSSVTWVQTSTYMIVNSWRKKRLSSKLNSSSHRKWKLSVRWPEVSPMTLIISCHLFLVIPICHWKMLQPTRFYMKTCKQF